MAVLRKTFALCALAVMATAAAALAGPLEASRPEATTILERSMVIDRDGERWETREAIRIRAPSFEARFESTKPTEVDAAFQLVVEPTSFDAAQLAKHGERIAASYAEPAKALQNVATGPLPASDDSGKARDARQMDVHASAARANRPPIVARGKSDKPRTRVADRRKYHSAARHARNGWGFGGFFGGFFGH